MDRSRPQCPPLLPLVRSLPFWRPQRDHMCLSSTTISVSYTAQSVSRSGWCSCQPPTLDVSSGVCCHLGAFGKSHVRRNRGVLSLCNKGVRIPCRACAVSHPTAEAEGLLWIWGSASLKPPEGPPGIAPELDNPSRPLRSLPWYKRCHSCQHF
jgi:hypothetical protein